MGRRRRFVRPRISPESPLRAWDTVDSYLRRKGYHPVKIKGKFAIVLPGFWGQRWEKGDLFVEVMWMPFAKGGRYGKWYAQTNDHAIKLPSFIETEYFKR